MIYTGIGSRKTPQVILNLMNEIGMYFGSYGWTLRSGGAEGADTAFEHGHNVSGVEKEIYLPCEGYRNHQSNLYLHGPNVNTGGAFSIAEMIWAKRDDRKCEWNNLKEFTKAAFARDIFQVLGAQLNKPSDILICWTEDGEASGGTGMAIKTAQLLKEIPGITIERPTIIVNLQKESSREAMKNILKGTDPKVVVDILSK